MIRAMPCEPAPARVPLNAAVERPVLVEPEPAVYVASNVVS